MALGLLCVLGVGVVVVVIVRRELQSRRSQRFWKMVVENEEWHDKQWIIFDEAIRKGRYEE